MKRLLVVAAVTANLAAGFGPTFAASDGPRVPPKGTEGPDIRARVDPKGTEGPDVRVKVEPKGIEGPDVR